ncbi:MAG: sensor histidine kinase, partial [Rubricoccaceae bacterium]
EANARLAEANARLEASLRDLRATQSQLVEQEKLASLGQLTAGIAHEIKNPLNFVNNFADLSIDLAAELRATLAEAAARPVGDVLPDVEDLLADLAENARRIRSHGQRADRIVRAMLLHSRGGAGVRTPVDVNAFAEEYANLAYHGARAASVDFQAALAQDLDPEAGRISVVPDEMGRVLINLFSNAFYAVSQHPPSGGAPPTVTLTTRRLPGGVEIRVADNGPGIPEQIRARIFEPFFTTKPAGQGTGLGLSLAFDIVTQLHGGTLRVETAPGRGSTFILFLPDEAPAQPGAAQRTGAPRSADVRGKTDPPARETGPPARETDPPARTPR